MHLENGSQESCATVPAPAAPRQDLYALDLDGLKSLVKDLGEPAFRAGQIYKQLYVKRAGSIDAMTDLPKPLREKLQATCSLGTLTLLDVQKGDGGLTRKAVFALPTGETVEAVLMVYPGRATVCVSSQAGCPMGCVFCATAKLGFQRDLTAGDIIAQVLWAAREVDAVRTTFDPAGAARHKVDAENFPRALGNVVFMGMGEPFNNYDAWMGSVNRLHDPDGFNLGARNFTVSTVGLVPGIQRLAKEDLPVNLAISLHAPDDELRSAMMPVNRRYPIRDLLQATRDYLGETNRRVSFEYVLLQGRNDKPEQAHALGKLLRDGPRLICHVNLIPWNPVPGSELSRSTKERVNQFRDILESHGVPCTIRVQRGVDIDAACGQLAGKHQTQAPAAPVKEAK
jgi:23S rRNA (adenine2503-C2)-methyltransferase